MTEERWALIKAYGMNPCPNCGSNRLWLNRVLTAPLGAHPKAPHIWWVECGDCHWCAKRKWLARRAIKAWQKETIEAEC